MRESCAERSALLRIAPHLVQPLPILIPTYGHDKNGKALLTAGAWTYDLLTLDRNRGIRDPRRQIPWTQLLAREDVLSAFPGLERTDLTGAVLFREAQMYNPPRLVLAFVRSAVDSGAIAANRVEAVGLLQDGNRIVGIEARERQGGERLPHPRQSSPQHHRTVGRALSARLARSAAAAPLRLFARCLLRGPPPVGQPLCPRCAGPDA